MARYRITRRVNLKGCPPSAVVLASYNSREPHSEESIAATKVFQLAEISIAEGVAVREASDELGREYTPELVARVVAIGQNSKRQRAAVEDYATESNKVRKGVLAAAEEELIDLTGDFIDLTEEDSDLDDL